MTNIATLEAAAHDPMPGLLAGLAVEYAGGIDAAFAAQIVASEAADFHWDARIAARKLGEVEDLDEGMDARACWLALGQLAGRWFVAKLLVDARANPIALLETHGFDSAWDAYEAFD